MPQNEFKAGDKVIINPMFASKDRRDRIFEVVKKNRVNYLLKPVDGVGPGVNAQPGALLPAPQHLLDRPIAPVAALCIGALVRVKVSRNIDPSTLFVVLSNGPKLKIAELGGNDDNYWTVPRSNVEKVSIDLVSAKASVTVLEPGVAANN
ncbi:hypothetical protein [Rhodococcus sp. Q]|uniref:hypothetical protein n=1 Tax=Rhodococcus sp. Q TaxID=2502252 RepID=UPI0010F6B4C9|nr:hypothetical protein [Rhodococcus sp. Q]